MRTKNKKIDLSLIEKELNRLIKNVDLDMKISIINAIRLLIKNYSPFSQEPIDCVVWIKNDFIQTNDYNPNAVAPPEMKLLEHSINKD